MDYSPSSCQYGFITAGAPAAHALGFKKGGLLSLETELFNVSQMLERFLIEQGDRRGSITRPGDEIQLAAQRFEELCLAVSIRRAIVTSQALTIVLAAVALKLEMNCNDASKVVVVDFSIIRFGFDSPHVFIFLNWVDLLVSNTYFLLLHYFTSPVVRRFYTSNWI